jgi:hypothetical protein
VTVPSRENAFIVFAQRTDARIDIEGWNAYATRFFSTRIGLTTDKRYAVDEPALCTDEAEFVVAPEGEPPGVRSTFARPCEPHDRSLAEAVDGRAGNTGLALLARRCGMIWMVAREEEPDPLALRLAAILAGVLLGPVLDAAAGELFGVKTARSKLESIARR